MKKILFILSVSFLLANFSLAQISYTNNYKVNIESDFDLAFVLDAHIDKNKNSDIGIGYRIQIANSSNREGVFNIKSDVYKSFSEFKSYIVYDQPYYKLRVGDFKTRLEARKHLQEITVLFPTAFIVSDEIKIK